MSQASIATAKNAVKTGIASWYQLLDEDSGRFFFYNNKTKVTAWAVPLRDCIPPEEIVPHGKIGNDDWELAIDPHSGNKFYQSLKYKKVQWTIPLVYRARLSKLPFFQQRRTSTVVNAKVDSKASNIKPKLQRMPSLPSMIAKISIEDVLENDATCAALHRYLVATHCEENLLFWASAEVFRVGKWKGMEVLGIKPEQIEEKDNEGEELLQQQLSATRASVRIGLSEKRFSAGREARLLYDKFLKPGCDMEICVNAAIAEKVRQELESGKKIDDRSLFFEAQEEVLRTLSEDALPRFLKVALSENEEVVGHGEYTFQTDEVVRTALKRIAGII